MTPLKTIIEQQQERLPEGYKRFSTAGKQTLPDLIAQTAAEGYLAGLRTALDFVLQIDFRGVYDPDMQRIIHQLEQLKQLIAEVPSITK